MLLVEEEALLPFPNLQHARVEEQIIEENARLEIVVNVVLEA